MKLVQTHVNTQAYPLTYQILRTALPSILQSVCYNDENLPFAEEVLATEIGHLFEHVLLEYLCQLRIGKGCKSSVFRGHTRWNWRKDPYGTFRIVVSAGRVHTDIFPLALEQSITLLKVILQSNQFSYLHENTMSENSWGELQVN